MLEVIAIVTAVLALVVAIATAWLTYFHQGVVRMTMPSMIVFSHDATQSGPVSKVMVRCLLFSTGERGRIIETLSAQVKHGASEYRFPVWGVDADNKLVRAGGLHVGKVGVVAWHHFVASSDGPRPASFGPGTY